MSPHPDTYRDIWYQREHERGYEAVEDLYSPGIFEGRVSDSTVMFRAQGMLIVRKTPIAHSRRRPSLNGWNGHRMRSATGMKLAGYHWFCESWGRDSAINARPAHRARLKSEPRAVLKRLSDMNQDGVIPNRFPDNYHTSDASLWFIHALARLRQRVGTIPSWRR